ncbi:amidase [Actinosynnema sp. NPDC020468]|uniref:amidase n=1 Tax=Actinosynnema sp. NPDC020468 TaxID=3154488 RepID=UPI0033F94E3B
MTRRNVRSTVRGAVIGLVVVGLVTPLAAHAEERGVVGSTVDSVLDRVTIVDLQQGMNARLFTSEQVTRGYLRRIDRINPALHAVLRVNPDAVEAARQSDARRRAHTTRGPLDGIPVLLKENTDTADRQPTTSGSTALVDSKPAKDAFLVSRLRDAGAVVLGKTNLSEWSNFRGAPSVDGWSAIGGQTRNPYVLDRSPCGSSSGAAAAAAAGLAAVTIGTDTGGSVICPASLNSTVGVKPTLGVVSRSGIVPITGRQDTPGTIARTVTDAALALWAIQGVDPADPDTAAAAGTLPRDPSRVLDRDAVRGKRIGVWRKGHEGQGADVDQVFDNAVKRLRELGATVVEGADVVPSEDNTDLLPALLTEFKHDLNAYLAATPGAHPKDLKGLIEFNRQHADVELGLFGQELFEWAERTDGDVTDPVYRAHRAAATDEARRGIDDVLGRQRLDAIVTLTSGPAPVLGREGESTPFASTTRNNSLGGYPHVTVPAGFTRNGLPLGLSFLGTRATDAKLVGFAYAYEQATHARRAPRYLPTTG